MARMKGEKDESVNLIIKSWEYIQYVLKRQRRWNVHMEKYLFGREPDGVMERHLTFVIPVSERD